MQIEMGNFEIPKISGYGRKKGEMYNTLMEFLNSDNQVLKISFDDKVELTRSYGKMQIYRKRNNIPIEIMKRGYELYIIRREKNADTED